MTLSGWMEWGCLGAVTLPVPPSANRLWVIFRGNPTRSAAYTRWLKECAPIVRENIKATTEPVTVKIFFTPGKGVMSTADLDNFIKPCLDLLTPEKYKALKDGQTKPQLSKPGAGVIAGDSMEHVKEISCHLMKEPKKIRGKRAEAEITIVVHGLTEAPEHLEVVA